MLKIPRLAPMSPWNDYPTSDGKPMAESDFHRFLMFTLIETLCRWFARASDVYVSGNLLAFYLPNDRRRHIAPDVFVVRGVPNHDRPNYLVWEEGQPPHCVIELTSRSTRREDQGRKLRLYRDVLKVKEYFLFDPFEDYLEPSMQGYRLRAGNYVRIRPVDGRLPSQVLGLHLERDGRELRLYDPIAGKWLLTPRELQAASQAETERERATRHAAETALDLTAANEARERTARLAAETALDLATASEARERAARLAAEAQVEQLRRELERYRGNP